MYIIIFAIILWNILLALVVAHYGQKREIGWLDSFFASLVFSPIIGFICVALSDKLNDKNLNHFKIINDKTITKQKPYSINALLILLAIFVLLGIVFTYNQNKIKTESCAKHYADSCKIDSAATEFRNRFNLLKNKNDSIYEIINK